MHFTCLDKLLQMFSLQKMDKNSKSNVILDGFWVELCWGQPEVAAWWDGIQLDSREDWNEDWAIGRGRS